MGRNPIIRDSVLKVLEETGPARFTDISEKVKKLLRRKKLNDKLVAGALTYLIKNGFVSKKIDENGHIVYLLSQNYFKNQLLEILRRLFEDSEEKLFDIKRNVDLYYQLDNIDSPPFLSFMSNLQLAFDPAILDWDSPANVIANQMLEILRSFDHEVFEGISNLLAHAYWIGVQDRIAGFENETLPETIERCRNFALDVLKKIGEKDPMRAKAEKALIQILDLTKELISKNNLKDFLDYLFKTTPTITRLQSEIFRPLAGGEKLWDLFLNYHDNVLLGLECAKIKVEQKYFLDYSSVWNGVIGYILLSYPEKEEWLNIKGSVEENIKKLKDYANEYLKYLYELPEKSKMIIVYCWGHPEIIEASEKAFLPFFEAWNLALKKGELEHRPWIFSEDTKSEIIKAAKRVKRGIPPEPIKIDYRELWTLKDLYEHHPRGKDPAFWDKLLNEIEKRSR